VAGGTEFGIGVRRVSVAGGAHVQDVFETQGGRGQGSKIRETGSQGGAVLWNKQSGGIEGKLLRVISFTPKCMHACAQLRKQRTAAMLTNDERRTMWLAMGSKPGHDIRNLEELERYVTTSWGKTQDDLANVEDAEFNNEWTMGKLHG
jgi:hypothetical protein